MLHLAPIGNLTKIWEKGQQLCLTSWSDLSNTSRNNIGDYCFQVPYTASLIEDALCLGDKEIVFGPGDLSWTLGASLVEVEKPWPSNTETSILSLKSNNAINDINTKQDIVKWENISMKTRYFEQLLEVSISISCCLQLHESPAV
ncbi:unnamed protein product [Dovyalis caffra]|uniref:Uncharacterized protein n=1 Tax=Dovyalis caffra TaxID=77055 RepID=A0AAV1QTG9_9ROSI|nr:unnamed protein product [Dovyalis caffra]